MATAQEIRRKKTEAGKASKHKLPNPPFLPLSTSPSPSITKGKSRMGNRFSSADNREHHNTIPGSNSKREPTRQPPRRARRQLLGRGTRGTQTQPQGDGRGAKGAAAATIERGARISSIRVCATWLPGSDGNLFFWEGGGERGGGRTL